MVLWRSRQLTTLQWAQLLPPLSRCWCAVGTAGKEYRRTSHSRCTRITLAGQTVSYETLVLEYKLTRLIGAWAFLLAFTAPMLTTGCTYPTPLTRTLAFAHYAFLAHRPLRCAHFRGNGRRCAVGTYCDPRRCQRDYFVRMTAFHRGAPP